MVASVFASLLAFVETFLLGLCGFLDEMWARSDTRRYIALQKAVLSKKGTSSRVNADENENLVGEVDAHTETATDTRPGAGNAGTRTEALTLFTKMSDFARVRHERGGGVAAGLVGYVSRDDFVHCCSGIDVDPATAASVRDSGKREACCRLNFLLALT